MEKLIGIWHRIYSDFLMPSRLDDYKKLLKIALDSGYKIDSIAGFYEKIETHKIDSKKRYLILRHDIDTDIKTAMEMWNIERSMGVISSYYFRLSTFDVNLMQEISKSGGEASYHFEEVATFAKKKDLEIKLKCFRI